MSKKSKSNPKTTVSPLMKTLATYMANAAKKPLPKHVAEKTKHHLLDTIAAMVSGSRLLPGTKAIAYAKTLGGAPQRDGLADARGAAGDEHDLVAKPHRHR